MPNMNIFAREIQEMHYKVAQWCTGYSGENVPPTADRDTADRETD